MRPLSVSIFEATQPLPNIFTSSEKRREAGKETSQEITVLPAPASDQMSPQTPSIIPLLTVPSTPPSQYWCPVLSQPLPRDQPQSHTTSPRVTFLPATQSPLGPNSSVSHSSIFPTTLQPCECDSSASASKLISISTDVQFLCIPPVPRPLNTSSKNSPHHSVLITSVTIFSPKNAMS